MPANYLRMCLHNSTHWQDQTHHHLSPHLLNLDGSVDVGILRHLALQSVLVANITILIDAVPHDAPAAVPLIAGLNTAL